MFKLRLKICSIYTSAPIQCALYLRNFSIVGAHFFQNEFTDISELCASQLDTGMFIFTHLERCGVKVFGCLPMTLDSAVCRGVYCK